MRAKRNQTREYCVVYVVKKEIRKANKNKKRLKKPQNSRQPALFHSVFS